MPTVNDDAEEPIQAQKIHREDRRSGDATESEEEEGGPPRRSVRKRQMNQRQTS